MNFLCWNVRGLESLDRRIVIKRLINSFQSIDFFMMQKVKAIGFMLESNLNFIQKDAIKLFTKHDRGRGGINYISKNGCSPCQRDIWCTFQQDDNVFGIFSIYASNDPKERSNLWDWLISLPNILWLFRGDFNMIES